MMGLNAMEPLTQITKNFKYYELTKSNTATRLDIDNSINHQETLDSVIALTKHILQPVRDEFGAYKPNSIYRSQALERVLKKKPESWISKSQHPKGQAGDIEVLPVDNLELANWIERNLDFDQLILECFDPDGGLRSGWAHVSYKETGNRKEVLSYIKENGKYIYVQGLVS